MDEYKEKEIPLNGAYLVLAKALGLSKVEGNIYSGERGEFRLTKLGFMPNTLHNNHIVAMKERQKNRQLINKITKLKKENRTIISTFDSLRDKLFNYQIEALTLKHQLSGEVKKSKKAKKKAKDGFATTVKKITLRDLVQELGLDLYEENN